VSRKTIRYALLCDGSSDQALIPIINWALRELNPHLEVIAEWVNLGKLRNPPALSNLEGRITTALQLSECDILFVHRDAEKFSLEYRKSEVQGVWQRLQPEYPGYTLICIIPVRMTEAWLLFDEKAIRKAASNPQGKMAIDLPSPAKIEKLPDPKGALKDILRNASGLKSRSLQKFNYGRAIQLTAEFTEDFSFLRHLPAFRAFEEDLKALSATLGIE
jgi:hypothetical protein